MRALLRKASRNIWRHGLPGTILALGTWGLPGPLGAQLPATRDSAGIQIVENPARERHSVNLRLGDRAVLTVGGLHDDNPDAEFDARQGYLRAARLSTGGLAVIDVNKVKFFDATGKLLRVSGRDGDGPGEFRYLTSICRTRGDTIVVADRARLGILDGQGNFVRHLATSPSRPPFDACFDDGTLVLVHNEFRTPTPTASTSHVTRVRLDGTLVATLGSFIGSLFDMVTQAELTWGAAGTHLILSDPKRRDILVFPSAAPSASSGTSGVQPLRSLRTADPVERISAAEAEARMASTIPNNVSAEQRTTRMDRMRAAGVPESWPAFGRVYGEPGGSIWAADYRRVSGAAALYSRFAANGRLEGRLAIPVEMGGGTRVEVIGFGRDWVLLRWSDADGAAYLSVYPIVPAR